MIYNPTSSDLINFKLLSDVIQHGDTVVDVGANLGIYTDFFKKSLNNTGKIYSIELHPDTYNQLKNRFNQENITVLNNAISNVDETIPFYKGSDSCTNNIIGHDCYFRSNPKIGEIQSIRLDTLFKNEKNIKILKIDVEGAENLVLEGLKGIYERVSNILVECHFAKDWEYIRNLLLNEYKFKCISVGENKEINNETDWPQITKTGTVFCKKI